MISNQVFIRDTWLTCPTLFVITLIRQPAFFVTALWKVLSISPTRGRALQACYPSKLKSHIEKTNLLILFVQYLSNLTSMYTIKKLPVHIFVLCVIIQYHFIGSIILKQTTPDLDSPKCVHHLTLNFAISRLFIENECRCLINFSILLIM